MKYAQFIDDAAADVALREADELVRFRPGVPDNLIRGQLIDTDARLLMRRWLNQEGISEGPNGLVQVNRRLYAPDGSSYRIPDVRVGSRVWDGSLTNKTMQWPQVRDFYNFTGNGEVTIVRPTSFGGAYRVGP